jgi:hypothetical protein
MNSEVLNGDIGLRCPAVGAPVVGLDRTNSLPLACPKKALVCHIERQQVRDQWNDLRTGQSVDAARRGTDFRFVLPGQASFNPNANVSIGRQVEE